MIFWISWPPRTARQFIQVIREQRYSEAESMFVPTRGVTARSLGEFYDKDYPAWDESYLELECRTVADYVCGRQQFKVCAGPDSYFMAERGRVWLRPNPWYVKVGWVTDRERSLRLPAAFVVRMFGMPTRARARRRN